jgi:hypothetical protein
MFRKHSALKRELARGAAGPGGLVPRTPGVRARVVQRGSAGERAEGILDVTAPGGLAIQGRVVHPKGAFAVAALVRDAELTPADAGVMHVVDLSSPASTGVRVTLPAPAELVGKTYEFVIKRDAAAAPNNAVFSLVLQDDSFFAARAVAAEAHVFPDPCYSLTTSERVLYTHTNVLCTPGVFCFYTASGELAASVFKPLDADAARTLVNVEAFDSSGDAWFADPRGESSGSPSLSINSSTGDPSSHGFRVSLASSCDTVRVWAAAPDLVHAECFFQYATAWSAET